METNKFSAFSVPSDALTSIMEAPLHAESLSLKVISTILFAGVSFCLGKVVYNVWFHPLAKFPGPKWNAAWHLPASYEFLRGKFPWYLHSLHERYGDVVRIRPGTLSFSSSQASKDILINKSGRDQLQKDPELFFKSPNGAYSILSTPSDTDHSRYRRLLSNGFSERAIRDQEAVLETYVDLLIQGLRQNAKEGPQDMVAWFNWTTFDVIGELTFDRSFDCLRNQAYHEWIPFVFGGVKAIMMRSELSRYPLISKIMMWLDREKILAAREKGFKFAEERVNHRFASATDRLDFFSHILRKGGKEREMSRAEILATSSTLILGGSDTTATLLAGTVYYLLQNPHAKQKLVAEIRSGFTDEADINITTVSKLPYLLATLDEAMRMYPPVALGSPRVVGSEGTMLGGYHVPPKTHVLNSQYVSAHSSRNFYNPESFAPERWLDDPVYENDDKAASIPFSLGPRNCIGKTLAYAEMRLILTRLLWNFDIEIGPDISAWTQQNKNWTLWEKPSLPVLLKPVRQQ